MEAIPSPSPLVMKPSPASAMALGQGAFYVVTGLWPLVHMPSFEAVTGPKTDKWLVRTVGGLLSVVGGALWMAGKRGHVSREMRLVAAGSAAVLTAIDGVYVSKNRISPVYLLDAVAETALIVGWGAAEAADPSA